MEYLTGLWKREVDEGGKVEYWVDPEREGWLMKQGEYLPNWRRRWFVLKQGRLFWFKDSPVAPGSRPRGVIPVTSCLSVKGAEDAIRRLFAFELSTSSETMFFVADSDKEKEDWINAIGRSIVQNSGAITESEVVDYNSSAPPPPPPLPPPTPPPQSLP